MRQKKKMDAILYAREHLAPWASQYLQVSVIGLCVCDCAPFLCTPQPVCIITLSIFMCLHSSQDFQRAVTLLAFSPTTKCTTYRSLFDTWHWTRLEQQFMQVRVKSVILHTTKLADLHSLSLKPQSASYEQLSFQRAFCYSLYF